MSKWPTTKISDICTRIAMGPFGSNIKVDNFVPSGVPVLNGANLAGIKLKEDSFNYVTEHKAEELKNSLAYRGDIVVTHRGTLGQIVYIPSNSRFDKYLISQSQFLLRVDSEKADNRFITYFFHSAYGQYLLLSNASQVGVPALARPTSTFKSLEIPLPPLRIQKRIADLLCLLDKKIQLNAQINQNLEQQIQAIFSHLINEPASFYSKLGDVCKCVLGGTPDRSKPEYWNGDIPWINSGKVNDFRITNPSELITEDGLKRSATKLLPSKTTVLAITGATLGQVSILEISACANQSVIGVIGNERTPYTFIYPFIKAQIGELMAHQTGGAQQHINKQNVEDLPIPIYAQDKMAEYDTVARPLFDAISCNCFENLRLATLRDTLLPKLMSGEIDVSEVEV